MVRWIANLLFVLSFVEMVCEVYGWRLFVTIALGISLSWVGSYLDERGK